MIMIEDLLDEDGDLPLDRLAHELADHQIDAGWRTDEELVLVDPGREDGTTFDTPALDQLNPSERDAALAAGARLLLARGELAVDEDGDPVTVGPLATIAAFFASIDRQTTIEVQRRDLGTRRILLRRNRQLRLIEDVRDDGLHRLFFVDGDAELDAALDLLCDGIDLADGGLDEPIAIGPPESMVEVLEPAVDDAVVSAVVSTIVLRADDLEPDEARAGTLTVYLSGSGCTLLAGDAEELEIRRAGSHGLRDCLAKMLP